jgi:hypothetical protein
MRFSLLTYLVEADFCVGKRAIIRAESHYEALAEASKRWGIPVDQLSASLHFPTTPTA